MMTIRTITRMVLAILLLCSSVGAVSARPLAPDTPPAPIAPEPIMLAAAALMLDSAGERMPLL